MLRGLLKFLVLILVVVGIGLVLRSVILKNKNIDDTFTKNKDGKYYQVTVSLLDKDTEKYISGSVLSVETENGKVIEKWTTKDKEYVITNLSKGKYILKQVSAAKGYDYNEEDTVFTITDKNLKLVVYNTTTDSENSTNNENETNTQNNENNENGGSSVSENVGVVDTLSFKNPLATIFGGLVLIAGAMLLVFNRKLLNIK